MHTLPSRRKKPARDGNDVVIEIRGAAIHVSGYEEPLAITLKQRVGSYQDIGLALNVLAEDLKRAVANGVNVQWPKNPPAEGAVKEIQARLLDQPDEIRRACYLEAEWANPVTTLADTLADADDEQAMTVVRALARAFGVDSLEGWEPEEDSSELGQRIESWLSKLPVVQYRRELAATRGLGCFASQMAAIKALACDGASPYEAKQAARRAFGVA